MAYLLQAFICKSIDTDCLTKQFDKAIKVDIGQELSLIPMTEELFDQINELEISESIDGFTYLTETVEKKILLNIRERQFSYVEADCFGGQGGQIAITWQDRKRQNIFSYGQGRINQVLKLFGVIANKGQDEFDTLGLGLHRETNDWLETQK